MKIFILGAGAIGSLLGARLSKENEVELYSTNEKHMRAIRENGLKIEELDGSITTYKLKTYTNIDEIEINPDLVLVTLKTYKTKDGLLTLVPRLNSRPIFLTLQNGIGNIERITELVPREQVIAGITAQGATLVTKGYIRHGGNGPTYIGEINGPITPRIKDIVEVFNKCGLNTYQTDDTEKLIWKKLLINIGINAITAIARVKNGYIATSKYAREISEIAVKEAIEVANTMGIEFDKHIFNEVIEVAKKTSRNISSMHQDILNKKITEIDSINGAIVNLGKELGIPTPVNLTLTNLIKLIEEKHKEEETNE